MKKILFLVALCAGLVTLAGCSDSSGGGNGGNPPAQGYAYRRTVEITVETDIDNEKPVFTDIPGVVKWEYKSGDNIFKPREDNSGVYFEANGTVQFYLYGEDWYDIYIYTVNLNWDDDPVYHETKNFTVVSEPNKEQGEVDAKFDFSSISDVSRWEFKSGDKIFCETQWGVEFDKNGIAEFYVYLKGGIYDIYIFTVNIDCDDE